MEYESSTLGFYKCYIYIKNKNLKNGWDRVKIINEFNKKNVPCYSGSCSEIYLEKSFSKKLKPKKFLKNARYLGERSIMFLVHPSLKVKNLKKTCSTIQYIFNLANK